LAADYSQIELRIMAHLSGDESLRAAFAADRDVHQATAAEVFGVGLDAVTPDQRRTAKVINFGLIYGMSAFGLARNLGIERGAAGDAPARLIMQVHDELVLEVREEAVEQVSAAVRERMVNAASLSVPLRVDVGVGANWDEAH